MKKASFHIKNLILLLSLILGIFMIGWTLLMFWVTNNDSRVPHGYQYMSLVITIVVFGFMVTLNKSTKIVANRKFAQFKCDKFNPSPLLEINRWDVGKYVGIDDKTGSILFISIYDKITKGLDIKNFTGYECRGNKITFKMNKIEFSSFSIHMKNENAAMSFCHKLDVLLSKYYCPQHESGNEFARFVEQKAFA